MSKSLILFITISFVSLAACAPKTTTYESYKPAKTEVKEEKPLTKSELIALEIKDNVGGRSKNQIVFKNKAIKFDNNLNNLYTLRSYNTAWYDDSGSFENSRTENLIKILLDSRVEGLDPESYNTDLIRNNIKFVNTDNVSEIANFDILLTNSILTYAHHVLYGDPEIGRFRFKKPYNEDYFDLALIFNEAISKNKIEQAIESLKPRNIVYTKLVKSLEQYRNIKDNGGWPTIKDGKKLELGTLDPRVAILRRRLAVTGDLPASLNSQANNSPSGYDKFDKDVENAVKNFQNRHNLLVDGVVGSGTIEALNVPVEKRIKQIILNLNMWRKIPSDLGDKYVFVNVPFFKLYTFQNSVRTNEMKVIVGKKNWNTPLFSNEIKYLEVNPYWNVPKSILEEDIIPRAKDDPDYVRNNNLKILNQWGTDKNDEHLTIMNSYVEYIDWTDVNADNWPFRLRQEPGPDNPLGNLKFMFPNEHNVYLHDTPLKSYFNRTNRSLSHGCIRVEKPLELADFLLEYNPNWSSEQLHYQIESRKNKTVSLINTVPVHIMYFTVWAEGNDTYFADDIYNVYRL